MTETVPTRAAFQAFRAVSVTTIVHSTTLASTVTGGVLRGAIPTLPGAAYWYTAMVMSPVSASIRRLGCLFVASGINFTLSGAEGLFDSFDNLII